MKHFARKFWKDQPVTDESLYRNRRDFIRSAAAASGSSLILGSRATAQPTAEEMAAFNEKYNVPVIPSTEGIYPATMTDRFTLPEGRDMTEIQEAFTYNNFYEFSTQKNAWIFVDDYEPHPWDLEVTGLCNKPRKLSYDDMIKEFSLEERVYRFRCVEAWSMVVPWTGFPLSDLLKSADPKSEATHVKFTSFLNPEQAPGQKKYNWYKWPYYEGARLDEAMNPLAFVATGIYGRNLPKQSGAPLRMVFPWKYGYKGPKAVVKIEFTDSQPETFWNDSQPAEYGFYSNVEPTKPHPRWSQATERVLGQSERIDTLLYNGYAEDVGHLYDGSEF